MRKRITKAIKISVIVAVSTLFLTVSGAALLIYLYPAESVLNIIKTKSEFLLGRKVDIKSLRYSIRGIVLQGVVISDTDPSGAPLPENEPLLKAEEAVIRYSPLSIVKKDFTINTLYFKKLAIRAVFDNNGSSNIKRLVDDIKQRTGSASEEKTSVKISKVILTDCTLKLINLPRSFKPLDGEYLVNSTIKIKDGSKLSVFDSGIILPQNRGKLFPEIEIDISDKFRLGGIFKLENCSLNWVYGFAEKPLKLPFDTVNGIVDNLEISLPHISGHANVTSTLKNSRSGIHADGSCIVDLDNNSVVIKDAKNRINNSSSILENLTINVGNGSIRRFSVSNLNYSISDLRQLEGAIPSGFSGNLKGSLSYNGSKFNGKIQIADGVYKDRTEVFSGLNTEIELNNNIFKKENIPVTVFGSSFNFSIAATDSNFKSIYVIIRGDRLDINKIKLEGGKSSSDFYFPVNISGKLQIGELLFDNLLFKNNQADFAASEKSIRLNRVDTSVFSGSISGAGRIDLSGDYPSSQLNAKFSNIKINDVKFKEENLNNRLFGFAEGTANLGFAFKENMTETMKGNTTFSVTKGKVVNTGIQNGLIIFLAELRYKLKDLEFSRINGNIDINGKDYEINSFIFNSEDLRLSMTGNINSELVAKNMTMKLEFNNHFIKDIPRPAIAVFRDYLSGKWYTIPFALNGNITDSKNIKMLKKDQ